MTYSIEGNSGQRRSRRHRDRRSGSWQRQRPQSGGHSGRDNTRPENILARRLEQWGIRYQRQFRIGHFVYDFRIGEHALIEVHGTHADPRFNPVDRMTPEQLRAIQHDEAKLHFAAEHGFTVKVVWEDDIVNGRLTREQLVAPAE